MTSVFPVNDSSLSNICGKVTCMKNTPVCIDGVHSQRIWKELTQSTTYKTNHHNWGLCQKQVSHAWISKCIPQNTVGCNYLSLPEIGSSGTKVLNCASISDTHEDSQHVDVILRTLRVPVIKWLACIYHPFLESCKMNHVIKQRSRRIVLY